MVAIYHPNHKTSQNEDFHTQKWKVFRSETVEGKLFMVRVNYRSLKANKSNKFGINYRLKNILVHVYKEN